ncbi:MAG: DUF1565 domain-containing protein, partial [Clostridia bacterium]|nr:DUF1565 domain-containing protein [Clostridia bacterium]
MKNRILTKLLALMITIIMCFSTVPALAISSPGITKFELDRSGLIESNGASLSDDKLVFEAGGSITFDVLLPFDTESIYFTYETITENTMFTIATDENSYTTWFAVGDVNTNKVVVTEVYGSNTITFTAAKAVTVTGVNFRKIDENYSETNSGDIPLTEYEYAVLTSVIFKNDASVVKTRGAIQNLNIENRRLSPMNIDGRLFVPFRKFAESLGYYAEDYPDKAYIYLTGETQSLALIKGKGYIESDKDGKRDFSLDVIYKSNMAWVPVRALSEALGFHVEYKEGFVVIDDRLSAKKVVEDEDIFTELKNEFNPHILAEEIKGNTYHVSQSEGASDSNAGTEKAPFKTLAKAATKANAGDTVIIHEGTYREKFRPRNDGTPSAPITFKAARGEKVVISALDKLSGFTAYQGKILKAQVTENLGFGRNQLFYKGEALNAGRHPNGDTKPGVVPYPKGVPEGVYATRGNIRITKEMNAGDKQAIAYSDTDLNYEENYWKGGTYVSLKGQGWSLVSGEITASKPGQLTVTDHAGSISYNLGLLPSALHGTHYYYEYNFPSDYAYITNHINTVDAEGEWFMAGDDNTMYVIPPANADPENDFEVKQRQLCIDLRGRKYITIEGIDTIGGGITMARETEGCVLNGGEFRYIAHHTILLDQSDYAMTAGETPSSKQSIKEGEAGICIDGKNNAIVNCKIDYSSATGVTLFGKYHYISNNTISNTSYSGGYPGGIWITPDSSKSADTLFGGHFITYNTVYNSGRSTLLMGSTIGGTAVGVAPVEIAYNRFFNG